MVIYSVLSIAMTKALNMPDLIPYLGKTLYPPWLNPLCRPSSWS